MTRRHLTIICLCVLGLASAPRIGTAQTPDKTADAGVQRIEIKDFHFNPMTLAVPTDTKIIFVNRDEEPHTVASVDGKFAKSKALDTDQKFAVTLRAPGDYGFFCTVHPTMTGRITVTATATKP